MSQNRWVSEVSDAPAHGGGGFPMPSFPNLEVAYLTDPAALAAALPPCFEPPDPWVAAGPNHILQSVNIALRITARTGGFSDASCCRPPPRNSRAAS